jgi:tRNA 2-thiouridine synthesizing protein B
MATLYQLHSTMATLRRSTEEMSRTWRTGDSILLLGSTPAFIDWLNAYLNDSDIDGISGIAGIYALADDIAQLTANTTGKLNLETKLTAILTDVEWVNLTQSSQFDKVVTIAL